jgi:hypothetical protein
MMLHQLWPLFFLMAAGAAQPSVRPPVIGALTDSHGNVQWVLGIPGSFVLAGTGVANVVTAAFSGSAGLLKTDNEALVVDQNGAVAARFHAPQGPALFGFDANGAPALMYCSGSLFWFRGNNMEQVKWTGDAISIAARGSGAAAVLVQQDRQTTIATISLADGAVINNVPVRDVRTPALLLPSGDLLFADRGRLVLRNQNGSERVIAVDFAVESFSIMGTNWVLVREHGGRLLGLHFTADAPELYQLPEVAQ